MSGKLWWKHGSILLSLRLWPQTRIEFYNLDLDTSKRKNWNQEVRIHENKIDLFHTRHFIIVALVHVDPSHL